MDHPVISKITKRAIKSKAAKYVEEKNDALIRDLLSGASLKDVDLDSKVAYVRDLLINKGIPVEDVPMLVYHNTQAASGVEMGLRNLVFNPSHGEDLSLPWVTRRFSAEQAWKLLNKLQVPKWMLELKTATLESISPPNVYGMINPDGSFNKDLEQLLSLPGKLKFNAYKGQKRAHEKAVQDIAKEVIEFHKESNTSPEYLTVSQNGKIRLTFWSLDTFKAEMSKAFKTSSPGYPYNGLGWYSNVDGVTAVEAVYALGETLVSNPEAHELGIGNRGFYFFQQSRATGDSGADEYGKQRLVQAAEAAEKLLGHIIAYAFKGPIKRPPMSGQNGIQAASRAAKGIAQGKISPSRRNELPNYVGYWDVSKWDAAQTDEAMCKGFFAVCEQVFDMDDPVTAQILTVYKRAYLNRILITAMGAVKVNMLPSGSSITTVSAFVHHDIYLRVMDEMCETELGQPLFCDYGLQGDDFIGMIINWSQDHEDAVKKVYKSYNCEIKGEMKIKELADENVSAIFLNEAILLKSDIEEYNNGKFPKWNLFWAENSRTLMSSGNIDRMLLDELQKNEPHPSSKELMMASLFSKLDRFYGLPFYSGLVNTILKRTRVPIYSWLVERVMPNSPTAEYLRDIELEQGIELPSPEQRSVDREEATWWGATDLGEALLILSVCSQNDSETAHVVRGIRNVARATKAYKRARDAMDTAGISTTIDKDDVHPSEAKELISLAFSVGYSDAAEFLAEVKSAPEGSLTAARKLATINEVLVSEFETPKAVEQEPIMIRTLMRSLLALNEHNPYELSKRVAQAIITTRLGDGWMRLSEDQRLHIECWFEKMYNVSLDACVQDRFQPDHSEGSYED